MLLLRLPALLDPATSTRPGEAVAAALGWLGEGLTEGGTGGRQEGSPERGVVPAGAEASYSVK